MRYSIMGCTHQVVIAAGGTNIKESTRLGIKFADLSRVQADKLKAEGYIVERMGGTKAVVTPPTPVQAVPTYSAAQLAYAAGLEDLRNMFDPPLYGEGFNVAVLDTGIRETHDLIQGRVVYRENFTNDPMRDGFNHGTGVASIIATIAPECGILNMKVLNEEGAGTEEEVVLAIDRCIDLHDEGSEYAPGVINLSLGVPDDGNIYSPIRIACRAAIEEGIWIMAAAGNGGPGGGTILSPACEKYVGAVGSIGYDPFEVSLFSSRGPTQEGYIKPDSVMFGEDIDVASNEGDTTTIAKSGTSFSAPFVSGMVLLYFEGAYKSAITKRQLVELPPAEITWITIQDAIDGVLAYVSTKPVGAPTEKDVAYGVGMPYGPLAAEAIAAPAAMDISALLGGMLAIGMMGVMVKVVK